MISQRTIIKRNTRLIARLLGKELAVLEPSEGKLHTLTETAAFIWRLLWKPRRVSEIVEKLISEFEVSPSVAKKDTTHFISRSLKNKLLTRVI